MPVSRQAWFGPSSKALPTYNELVASLNPTGWWKLDETSGTTAEDSSGNGYDGTISGTVSLGNETPTVPMGGTSYKFQGGAVTVSGLTPTAVDAFTLIAWVEGPTADWYANIVGTANPYDNTTGFSLGGGASAPGPAYQIITATTSGSGESSIYERIAGMNFTSSAKWALIAASYSDDQGGLFFGSVAYTTDSPDAPVYGGFVQAWPSLGTVETDPSGTDLVIGGAIPGSGSAWAGFVAQVAYWQGTLLTLSDVWNLFMAGFQYDIAP